MLRISKKLMFAIEAVLDIAYNAGSEPVQSGEITRRQGIPKRYLEQVLQQLVRHGILAGVRGPRGGYRLDRPHRAEHGNRHRSDRGADGFDPGAQGSAADVVATSR
jgi:Rrf2 family protein